jgi:hypothetical protein
MLKVSGVRLAGGPNLRMEATGRPVSGFARSFFFGPSALDQIIIF